MKVKPVHFSVHSLALMVLLMGLVESCSTTKATQITGSWRDPGAKSYKDFFVAVLSKNLPARTALENDISRRLKSEGVKAVQSLNLFPHSDDLDTKEEKQAAVEKIQSLGHDAIITVVLVQKVEEEKYVPGATSYAATNVGVGTGYYNPARGGQPPPGYNSFGGYYTNASTVYTTPGYYEKDKTYFVESNLYDARTAKLIWSAQSETFNPSNISNASQDFSSVMVEAMKKAKLIYKKN